VGNSLPALNCRGSGTVAAINDALIGLLPGIVTRRRLSGLAQRQEVSFDHRLLKCGEKR
jgi:hypothetical protein